MATASVPVTKIVHGLVDPSPTVADTTNFNHLAANDGARTFLRVKNPTGGSANVTLVTSATFQGRAVADDTAVAVAASAIKWFGPFPTELYGTRPVVQCSAALELTAFIV